MELPSQSTSVVKETCSKMSEGIYEFEGNVLSTNIDCPLYGNVGADKPKPGGVVIQHSAYSKWWKRPSGVAAVCLGLLCVLLLAEIIGLSVYYGIIGCQYFIKRDNLQTSYNNLTKERDQLHTSYNNLTKETDQLQTRYKTLSEERDQLQTSYNNLTKERDQLQNSYNNLTKERDQIHTSYNNLTKERDQLHTSYNNLTKEKDELQTRCKPLSEERDQLQTSNNNLTKERDGNSQMLSVKYPYELKEFGNSSYFISTTKNNWDNATQDCRNRGTKLVIINNLEEQKFLISLNINTWIGLSDIETEGTWRWVDGTPLTTAYWGPQQPDNSGDPEVEEDCVEIVNWNRDPVKMWNDMKCNTERNWICEAVKD
ncbi:CD209 antigen-like isoform X1 [Esox lucius]|uniref:C-type lectin domain-containing protein n=1 Tax=Esox lucius TaxID=8010 RepID=A0A6Q2ZIT3_ESOLU|nr:CD209 antigen-like isoform X1 [Esox lucius]XP_034147077.1 CD209 antigen-like isoform X1 [Esox lucius]